MTEYPERLSPPLVEELRELAARERIDLAEGEAEALWPVVASLTDFEELLEQVEGGPPAVPAGREPGRLPDPEEDPFNAFVRYCDVRGASEGPLAGRTVGVKDNISVAGVPTTNGSRVSSYVPAYDAVVVERILAAGGTIVGKLNMDDFGSSGLGETSAFGPARNPVDPTRSAGGSSGGSGAAVRSGEVDLSLAVDQGGSGRIPAAFCGLVGIKATHGLVPSWGISHIDHTIDFVTPLTRTVADAALMLGVIAGPDERDAQWVRGAIPAVELDGADEEGVDGLRLGVLVEACAPDVCEPAVVANLHGAVAALEAAGAIVEEVSIPAWEHGLALFLPYVAHLFGDTFRSGGQGTGHLGTYDLPVMRALTRIRQEEGALLPDQVKAWLLADRYVHDRYGGLPYARLHNARLALRASLDAALAGLDALLTPTLPITAPPLLTGAASFAEVSGRTAARLCYNTAPLNLTGHPALSVPSGVDADGLPTALQVVARHFAERVTFQVGYALERETGPFVPPSP
ncbi:MAG: amidase family protein [Gaiellales bacterium]